MTIDSTDCTPPPTFDVLPLSRELRQAIDELGYTHPTPVQREVFEPAKRGRDVVVQARTGTGKTAAFGMPVVDALVQRSLAAVQVLILCPTRELALQVHRELDTLGRYRGVKSVAVYGGAPMGRQIEELAAGAQVLAGTPGRVLDHLRRGSLDPSSIRVFILDESDEMLSMGFLPQINEILGFLPAVHQTLLFSATLPADIQRLAETRLRDPLFLTLSGDQIGALDIQHLVYFIRGDKLKDFVQVLEVENPESAIVFCNTRDETKRVAGALERLGFSADWLNADLAQNEREKVMAATRGGDLRFLVCTDVAARGIDISHLTHVINFDLPESPESYVHRTGRTGRAGRTGTAISLIEPSDIGRLYMLRLLYKIFPIEKQIPSAGELRTRQELDVVEMFVDAFANRPVHAEDLSLARRLLTHDDAPTIVAGLLRDHLGARPEATREATEARRARVAKPEGSSIAPPGQCGPGRQRSREEPPSRGVTARNASPGGESSKLAGPPSRRPLRAPEERRQNETHREPNGEAASSAAARPRGPENVTRPNARISRNESVGGGCDARPNRGGGGVDSPQIYRDEDFEFTYSVADVGEPVAPQGRESTSKVVAVEPAEPPHPTPIAADSSKYAEIFVNVGRVDGAEPAEFLRIFDQAGLSTVKAPQISVRRNHSFIKLPASDFETAAKALNGATIAGRVMIAERSRSSRS